MIVLAIVIIAAIGAIAFSGLTGSGQLGACVEEWGSQSPTRKENYTRGECESFCASDVNSTHLACYFDPYRLR